jgi:hypothetical protein
MSLVSGTYFSIMKVSNLQWLTSPVERVAQRETLKGSRMEFQPEGFTSSRELRWFGWITKRKR